MGALPIVRLLVDGVRCDTLVDTGCTKSIAHVSTCSHWTKQEVQVVTVGGERYKCEGTGVMHVRLPSGGARGGVSGVH